MRPSDKKPTPLWREFEQLVARIEHSLAGSGVTVTSPDRVASRVTLRKREVDASLRARVGSAEILVTIECRKRRATQDVTWIEQLGCKKLAIGASRTIAVASTSFSKDAVRAAGHYDIDLRVLSEVTDAEVHSWILPRSVVHIFKFCDLIEQPEIIFREQQGDDFAETPPAQGADSVDSPVFVTPDGRDLTLNDLWLRVDDQMKIFDSVPTDDKAHVRRVTVHPSDELQLRTRLGLRRVHEIKMALSLRWKHEQIPLGAAKVVLYRPAGAADSMPTQVRAEFESKEATNVNFRLGMQFEPGATEATFSLEPLPCKK